MENRVKGLLSRLQEVEDKLGEEGVLSDKKRYKALLQEYSYLGKIESAWRVYSSLKKELDDTRQLLREAKDEGEEFLEMLRAEVARIELALPQAYDKLEELLVPPDPRDSRSVIVEIRAGTGGDEAALFVGDCVRMYQYFAVKMDWKCEMLSCNEAALGGYKEFVFSMQGENVHRFMQYEAGTHRVQRVPATETQGRVHTSAVTMAVLIEPDEDEEVVLDERDLRFDTYRSTGAGGQHVNTTDSAVRVTHIPTGMVCYSMQERSQHKNKAIALRLLAAKIREDQERKKMEALSSTRAAQIGSGDRSERIRTYNFSQNRLTDHRVPGLTLYNLHQVMEGELKGVSEALIRYYHEVKLKGGPAEEEFVGRDGSDE